ncbi:MAG: hypothetical protein HQM16_12630 [Deltaproteobacteria bacterium]|nr:hypothetical protein [Deltaproteobacteria bacterium]
MLLTTSQKEIPCAEENIIRLEYFNKQEVAQYLADTVGLTTVPNGVIDDLYKYTNSGCPLYLVEFLKAAFSANYLIDRHGKWSEKIFDDLVTELKTKGLTDFIKDDLRRKIDVLNLKENQLDIMFMMALTDKPTLIDIKEITSGHLIEEELEFFVRAGVLRTETDVRYVFTNPLYKAIFIEMMPDDIKTDFYDSIADHYMNHGESE